MKRRLAVVCIFILASLAGPSLFAAFCHDCPDGVNCVRVDAGGRICEFFIDGGCIGIGICPSSASLQAEYRVAAVRVIDPNGKPLPAPNAQPQPAAILTAAK